MPLCQIAQARILHRRRHTMPSEEWESRAQEPMHYNGPIGLRPRIPEEWKKKGGMTEFFMLIGVYECTLPRMPSCDSSMTDPWYDDVNNALFHELSSALYVSRLENQRKAAQLWEKNQSGEVTQQDLEEFGRYLDSFPCSQVVPPPSARWSVQSQKIIHYLLIARILSSRFTAWILTFVHSEV
jgi:hypothetical protein